MIMSRVPRSGSLTSSDSVLGLVGGKSRLVAYSDVLPFVAANISLLTGKTLWVDAINGNNTTGTRGVSNKPFLTITAALTAASSGDTVIVRSGDYNENVSLKTGVNIDFQGGARLTTTGGSYSISDNGVAVTCYISGLKIANNGFATKGVVVSNASSVITISADEILTQGSTTAVGVDVSAGIVRLTAKTIRATGSSCNAIRLSGSATVYANVQGLESTAHCVAISGGTLYLTTEYIYPLANVCAFQATGGTSYILFKNLIDTNMSSASAFQTGGGGTVYIKGGTCIRTTATSTFDAAFGGTWVVQGVNITTFGAANAFNVTSSGTFSIYGCYFDVTKISGSGITIYTDAVTLSGTGSIILGATATRTTINGAAGSAITITLPSTTCTLAKAGANNDITSLSALAGTTAYTVTSTNALTTSTSSWGDSHTATLTWGSSSNPTYTGPISSFTATGANTGANCVYRGNTSLFSYSGGGSVSDGANYYASLSIGGNGTLTNVSSYKANCSYVMPASTPAYLSGYLAGYHHTLTFTSAAGGTGNYPRLAGYMTDMTVQIPVGGGTINIAEVTSFSGKLITGSGPITITNYYAFKVETPTIGSASTTISTAYGLYIPDLRSLGGGSTGYGVRQTSTSMINVFAGSTKVGADTAPTSVMDVAGPVATAINSSAKTTTYPITVSDSTIVCDTSAGAFAVTLPTCVTCKGRIYVIVRNGNGGANAVSINTTSSQTVSGNASGALQLTAPWQSVQVQSDSNQWIIISAS